MANAAEAEAESAKKKGDQTLAEAEEILDTLKGKELVVLHQIGMSRYV